jgi:murein DD-endopeptidase MepM/ murein hydrolase activator NlpD
MRFLRWLSMLGFLIGFVVLSAAPAALQCSVRTDWDLYTVVRGDTLYSIARRFNTTATNLAAGNCLPNASRIVVGQQLRVPPRDTSETATPILIRVPDHPGGSFIVGATYQQFEHGFMTWRSDSGAIWVFYEDGHVVSYPLHMYGGLAISRRFMTTPIPDGRNLPTNGFMRVYDNFPEVREKLGWAIGGEQGYDMMVTVPTFGSGYFIITVPDGQEWSINSEGIWGHVTGVRVPPATPTPAPTQSVVGATFQPFEHGFMVWREDNGEIRVYVGGQNGELSVFTPAQYGALPTRQFTPPSGRWYPQFGFGRVWSSMPGVRERLGWAMSSERGYDMILAAVEANGDLTSFSLPDGRFLTRSSDTDWIITTDGVLVNP